MTQCNYELDGLKCDNPAIESGKCKFHDEEYYKTHSEEIEDLFYEKLKEAQEEESSLDCTGYNLTNIEYHGEISDAIFYKAKFHGEVDFTGATFTGEHAFFVGATFSGKYTYFTRATFTGEHTFFTEAKFSGSIDFTAATFSGKSTFFDGATFSGEYAFFDGATFSGHTSFDRATFSGKSIFFVGATFSGKSTFFDRATFLGEHADFTGSKFQSHTEFSLVRFNQSVDFKSTEFSDGKFFRTIFRDQENVIFDTDLTNLSFLETDITRVRFGAKVAWNKGKNDFKVKDERNLEEFLDKNSDQSYPTRLQNIVSVYRNLRENYEYYMMYETAGKFFIREMEMRRKYIQQSENIAKRNWLLRTFSATGLYFWTSKYGEDFARPIVYIMIAVALSSIYFGNILVDNATLIDPITGTDTGKTCSSFVECLPNALARSGHAFSPTFTFPENPTIVDYALKILIFPIAATLFITIRRRLERRFRH